MLGALEVSLDLATAASIIGAAIAFILQQRRESKVNLREARWNLLWELANKFTGFKMEILQEMTRIDSYVTGGQYRSTTLPDGTEKTESVAEMVQGLFALVNRTLSDAQDYADNVFRTKAKAISSHFRDQDSEDWSKEIEKSLKDMHKVTLRMLSSHDAAIELNKRFVNCINYVDVYCEHLLPDLGYQYPQQPERSMGKDLDDLGEKYAELPNSYRPGRPYMPRRYIKKNEQPLTAFDVLDDFVHSMLAG